MTRQRAELNQHTVGCETSNDLSAYFSCDAVDRILYPFTIGNLLQASPQIFVFRADNFVTTQSLDCLCLCASVNDIDCAESVNLGKLQDQSAHAGRGRRLQNPLSRSQLPN